MKTDFSNFMAILHSIYNQVIKIDTDSANRAILATTDIKRQVSLREVSIRLHKEEIVFINPYNSQESINLISSPVATLYFSWKEIKHHIQIQGKISRLSNVKADLLFDKLSRSQQLAAWVSNQSHFYSNHEEILLEINKIKEKFDTQEIPRPSSWGGYKVIPYKMELCHQNEDHIYEILHYHYVESDSNWSVNKRVLI